MATRNFVEESYSDEISGVVEDYYIITNGKSLSIKRMSGGSSLALGNIASTKIELFYDPNGDGSNLTLIQQMFVSITDAKKEIKRESFPGDGTARIITRRTPIEIGSREVFVTWEGFES